MRSPRRSRLLPDREVYFASEAAALLGMSLTAFYQARAALEQRGMPSPLTVGRWRFDRRAFDAWRHGRAAPAPANDPDPTEPDWQKLLADEYRQPR